MKRAQILSPRQLPSLLHRLKKNRQRIVFTNGCFDLLHPGHIALLFFAKSQADVLIVGVNSDRSIHRLKGPARPIMALADRLKVLAALRPIDYLISFSELTPQRLVRRLRPDILVKGADWKASKIVGARFAKKVIRFPLLSGLSTTRIIERIQIKD